MDILLVLQSTIKYSFTIGEADCEDIRSFRVLMQTLSCALLHLHFLVFGGVSNIFTWEFWTVRVRIPFPHHTWRCTFEKMHMAEQSKAPRIALGTTPYGSGVQKSTKVLK